MESGVHDFVLWKNGPVLFLPRWFLSKLTFKKMLYVLQDRSERLMVSEDARAFPSFPHIVNQVCACVFRIEI